MKLAGECGSYPGRPCDVQVLHHFFERSSLLCLFLVMQRDFFAKFARIVRGRHLSPSSQWNVTLHVTQGPPGVVITHGRRHQNKTNSLNTFNPNMYFISFKM